MWKMGQVRHQLSSFKDTAQPGLLLLSTYEVLHPVTVQALPWDI